MNDSKVTERDLEVARQMGAPERVLESMEAGEWLYPSDREAVRYAEIAIDHMLEAHAQACEARWSTVPWLLEQEARVNVVAKGGAYDGLKAVVNVSTAEGHPCTDNWYMATHSDEYAQAAVKVIDDAFGNLPRVAWAAEASLGDRDVPVDIADDTPVEEALTMGSAKVDVFLAASAVPDEAALEELRVQVLRAYESKGYDAYVWLAVVPDAPDGAEMTVSYGRDQVKANAELMTTSGIYRKG